VPENAVRFVSVFGVDNEISDERASIRCQIYFDGNLAHTTGVVSAGGYEIIDIKVPHGTKSMTISITDEGSNIYDHASLGNAGFVTTASDIRQNPDIYLSSDWVSETHGWNQPIGVNQSIDGDAIRLNGKTYTHGIATHADSTIVYNIPYGATRFVARGGIDDEVTSCIADVIFKVYIDGKLCYQSPFVSKYEACGIDVAIPTGAERITLEVTAGSSAGYDHATWANAGFIQ
ncbi:MAG: NPCBM/NEW2 domain-containing protein, partial [Clostridia bacterium]|nr:NPCBM/NEW2 domain-containing protein [Clostridia bacterium]